MIYRIGVAAVFFMFSAAVVAQPQTPEGGGIVYGTEIGVGLSAPAGWVFDSECGVSQGLHAVMYPVGSSWADAGEVMYVNIVKLGEGETLGKFIEEDIASFKERSPDLVVKVGKPIQLKPEKTAQTRLFTGDAFGNFEFIAYAAHRSSVAIYVLSCRTKECLEKSLPAFREMVKNSFLTTMDSEK